MMANSNDPVDESIKEFLEGKDLDGIILDALKLLRAGGNEFPGASDEDIQNRLVAHIVIELFKDSPEMKANLRHSPLLPVLIEEVEERSSELQIVGEAEGIIEGAMREFLSGALDIMIPHANAMFVVIFGKILKKIEKLNPGLRMKLVDKDSPTSAIMMDFLEEIVKLTIAKMADVGRIKEESSKNPNIDPAAESRLRAFYEGAKKNRFHTFTDSTLSIRDFIDFILERIFPGRSKANTA